MRKPLNEEEAKTFFFLWKDVFDFALHAHTKASLTPPAEGEKFEIICRVVQSAAQTADQALAAIVKANDEIRGSR